MRAIFPDKIPACQQFFLPDRIIASVIASKGARKNEVSAVKCSTDPKIVNKAALMCLPSLVRDLWPDGDMVCGFFFIADAPQTASGGAYVVRVNLRTGAWVLARGGTVREGGNPVGMLAALDRTDQSAAAERLAGLIGLGRLH